MSTLHLTECALSDIDDIERFSVERWGVHVADRYVSDLNDALARLSEDISLFRKRGDYTGRLRFYNVREHVIIGDIVGDNVYVLTVWWAGMDFIDRFPKLEPDLIREAELLAQQTDPI